MLIKFLYCIFLFATDTYLIGTHIIKGEYPLDLAWKTLLGCYRFNLIWYFDKNTWPLKKEDDENNKSKI
jgi:hypothetical protein